MIWSLNDFLANAEELDQAAFIDVSVMDALGASSPGLRVPVVDTIAGVEGSGVTLVRTPGRVCRRSFLPRG